MQKKGKTKQESNRHVDGFEFNKNNLNGVITYKRGKRGVSLAIALHAIYGHMYNSKASLKD